MNFKNHKITFHLQTPICLTFPWMFFDSLLSHLAARKFNPQSYRYQDSKVVNSSMMGKIRDIPVQYTKGLGYHASASQLNDESVSIATIYKRFSDVEVFKLMTTRNVKMSKGWKVRRGQGHYKDYMIKLVTFHVPLVSFYFRGDAKKIASMLQDLPALGKKKSIGFGFIKDYKIEDTDEDYSFVKDGVAMRPIPVELADEYDDQAMMNHSPPYWSNNVKLCVPPGAKVSL